MIWDAIIGKLFVLAIFGAWISGRLSAATRAKNRGLREYQKTRKAIDNVEDLGDDPAVLRGWLRERGKSKRDM